MATSRRFRLCRLHKTDVHHPVRLHHPRRRRHANLHDHPLIDVYCSSGYRCIPRIRRVGSACRDRSQQVFHAVHDGAAVRRRSRMKQVSVDRAPNTLLSPFADEFDRNHTPEASFEETRPQKLSSGIDRIESRRLLEDYYRSDSPTFAVTNPKASRVYDPAVTGNGDRENLPNHRAAGLRKVVKEVRSKAHSVRPPRFRRPKRSSHNTSEGLKSNAHKPHQSATTRSLLLGDDNWDSPAAINPAAHHDSLRNRHPDSNANIQDLERYAAHESEDTTRGIQNCVKLVRNINDDVANTLVTLHQQTEKIKTAHEITLEIDENLNAGERLLSSLGSVFSKTWKPVKTRAITGPVNTRSDSVTRRIKHLERRLGFGIVAKDKTLPQYQRPAHTYAKLELEQMKQEESLSHLSNLLVQLKDMSLDVGKEISRHTEALDPFQDEVMELGQRVKRANLRGRYLLGR